ncbi:pilus assembly protein TadG-related protein [Bradyrhizobium sp. Tv2a-2]|uniref:pilus assembly protein TadG-related protein n=1 Tax=Bradyrhizobium sp. Tv2a-2 TaxID=113395 RepID=UPI000A0014F7|nr:pilus assembly protein TadG-related protein [Bradyrhizobium sp. Tv2a-2]
MRNLLRSRRGSVAFATVIALVPLIGVVALGGEAGSWYVTKQRAQNAADAAAYAGGLWVACSLAPSTCTETQSLAYRGKEFAAQNTFCNAGDTSYPDSKCSTALGKGTSQTVQIASLASWNGTAGNFVQATVSQQQPTYLAAVLGLSTVNISATAVAQAVSTNVPGCVLALSGSLQFQGSPNINAPGCSVASNDRNPDAINFIGGGMTMNVGSLAAAGGCTGSTSFCNTALTYMPPVTNPFSGLDGALTTLCGSNPTLPAKCGLAKCTGSGLTAYTAATPCVNDSVKTKGNTAVTLTGGGVYFISGTLTLVGGSSITSGAGGALIILLPGASIDTKGGGVLTISGLTSAPGASSLPTALQSSAALFQYMSIYDASATAVTFGGNSNINLTGSIYAPTAAVTFQGNPTLNLGGANGCGELIAASVAFNGNATFNDNSCPAKPSPTYYVKLVQ